MTSIKIRPDLIFFVVGFFIFPAVIIISVYSIFKVNNDVSDTASYPVSFANVANNSINENAKVDEEESTKTSENAMTSSTNTVRTGHSEEGYSKSFENQKNIETSGNWIATQYDKGDIIKNTYVVQLGDTLWQIAQAYYGSGTDWVKILEANTSKIGFLPNGEQALINPGQILILP